MRLLRIMSCVGLFTSPACAASLAPTNTSFVSAGKTQVSTGALSANCTVRFSGRTDSAGVGHIGQASFSGGPIGGCGAIRATGLPWTMRAVAPGRAVIGLVSVRTPFAGDCAARDVPVNVDAAGVITFPHVPLPPKCEMNGGRVVTRPPLRVAP